MDSSLSTLRSVVLAASEARKPLRLRGAGTKDFYGETLEGEVLDTRVHAGIVDYEPSELVLTVKCGTPLSEIARALEAKGQYLAFEAPRFGGDPTIGGIIASGLSGPRRAQVGAVRDFVLGVHLLAGDGEVLRFGGQVMKNVAGFDVSRLLCGSLGILGLITQVSLRLLPRPRVEETLSFELSAAEAVTRFNQWGGHPLPISATFWCKGEARVRLSGSEPAVASARQRLGGNRLNVEDATRWWDSVRDHTHPFFNGTPSLWRLSVPATTAPHAGEGSLFEWNGGVRWVKTDEDAAVLRARVSKVGGTALHWRGRESGTMFHPLPPAVLEIHRRLKQRFDPHGIFNRGRLVTDF